MLNMKLPNPRQTLILAFSLAALTGCFKQQKAPQAPARKGAQSSDQCGRKSADSSPAPSSGSYGGGGGAYLAGVKGTWQEVKTLLERDCTSCHPTYTDYETSKLLADKFVKTTDDGTMPKNGERLALDDRTVYILWANNGAPNDGEAGTGGSTGSGTATTTNTATGTGDEVAPTEDVEPTDDEAEVPEPGPCT